MDLQKVGWGAMDWIHLAQDRVNAVNSINYMKLLYYLRMLPSQEALCSA
jgi:hypothetical protein